MKWKIPENFAKQAGHTASNLNWKKKLILKNLSETPKHS